MSSGYFDGAQCNYCEFYENYNVGNFRKCEDDTYAKGYWDEEGECRLGYSHRRYQDEPTVKGGDEACDDFMLDSRIERLNHWNE